MSRRRRGSSTAALPGGPGPRPAAPAPSARRPRDAADAGRRTRRLLLGAIGALVGASLVVVLGFVVLRPGSSPEVRSGEPAGGGSVAVGTAVGQRAPNFQLVDVDGRTVSSDSLRGKPALLWFTASYCVPCQEGALRLQSIVKDVGVDRLAIVIVFVDPTEPPAALREWRQRFGLPGWAVGFAAGSLVTDFRIQYLDTKYLLDGDGIIRETDFFPLREDVWREAIERVVS